MVLPLLAVAAATAAANYYQGEQNRAANQKLADQMRDRINGVQAPQLSEEDYAYQGLDPSMLNYNQYQYLGDYTPESGEFVREVDPTLVKRSEDAKFGRDAQMEALKKFRSNIASGYDPEFASKLDQASTKSNADAQSRMSSILEGAERRGQLGSNAMLSKQMQQSSDALSKGAQESQAAAVAAYQNILQQQRDAANLGGQIVSADQSLDTTNAGITNSFNQRTSKAYQDYLDQQASMNNSAQLRNLNTKQTIGNQNTELGNKQTQDRYQASEAERAYQNKLATQRQGVQQQNFNNAMSKATGNNAQTALQMGANDSATQARMNAVQGLGEGVAGYYGNEEAKDARAEDRKWQTEQRDLDRQAKYGSY